MSKALAYCFSLYYFVGWFVSPLWVIEIKSSLSLEPSSEQAAGEPPESGCDCPLAPQLQLQLLNAKAGEGGSAGWPDIPELYPPVLCQVTGQQDLRLAWLHALSHHSPR